MADGSTKPLAEVRVGDDIYGTIREGYYRRYALTTVLGALVHGQACLPRHP